MAAVGGLSAIRTLTATTPSSRNAARSVTPLGEHMIVHVRDIPSGEIAVMAGTTEIVYRDAEVVARLVQGARQAQSAGTVR